MKEYSRGSAEREAKRIVGDRQDKLGRATGLELFKRITDRTPVDTGRARANWNTNLRSPDLTSSESTDASAAQLRARNAAQSFALSKGQEFYVANGLPYIEELEEGSSTQAPAGMVKITVMEMQAWIKRMGGRLDRG